MKEIIIKLIKKPLFWILLFESIFVFLFFSLGFRISYPTSWENDWTAIGAVGQWASAIVGLLIPIAVIYIQHKLDTNKRDISEANIDLLSEFENLKKEISDKLLLVQDKSLDPEKEKEEQYIRLKEKALKYINISMFSNTLRVAEHLEISKDDAFELLNEMLRHDGSISAGGAITKDRIDNIVWLKKKK